MNCRFCGVLLPCQDLWLRPPVGTRARMLGQVYGPCCQELADDTDWVLI